MEIDMPDENSVEAIARRDSHSRRNSENIKKRLSQIEVEINEMNELLTENIDITQKMMIEDETRVDDNVSKEETKEEEKTREEENDDEREVELAEGEDEEEEEEEDEDEKDNHQLDNMEKLVIETPVESKETADSFLGIENQDQDKDSSEEIESEQQLLQDILDTPFNFSAVSGTDEFLGPGRVRRASSNYSNRSPSPSSSVKDKIESIEAKNKPLENEFIVDAQIQEENTPLISDYKRTDNTVPTGEAARVVSNSVKSPFRVVSVSHISGNRSSSDLTQDNTEQQQQQQEEQGKKKKEITVGNKKDNNSSFVQESINKFNDMRDSFIAHSEIDKKKFETKTSKTVKNEETIEIEKSKKMTVSSLQLVYDHLDAKINKVEREIEYLNKILMKGGLNLSDSKNLHQGIQKLENYLDKKIKLRHEIGVKLSRKLRHKIEMGENEGIFFSGKI